jgi:hypothetical protein
MRGAIMPRYYFHVYDGRSIPDEDGVTLAGADDARAKAITAAAEALWDLGPRFWSHPDWRMHVTDEEGATVCDLRLSNQPGSD